MNSDLITTQPAATAEKEITVSDIVNITWFNIKYIKPADLERVEIYKKLKRFVEDIDVGNEGLDAKECFDIIWGLLNNNPTLGDKNPTLLRQYFELLVVLRANFLGIVGDLEVLEFLQQSALLALTIQANSFPYFDFQSKLQLFMTWDTWYFDDELRKSMRTVFVKALEQNEELLGEAGLTIKDKNFKVEQVMRNWLYDYNLTVSPKNGQRGALERLAYLNSSPNVRNLDEDQRILLTKYLELYDWLRFGKISFSTIDTEIAVRQAEVKPLGVAVPSPRPSSPPPPKPPVRIEPEVNPAPTFSPIAPLTPAELKREILTPELPRHEEGPLTPRPQPPEREAVAAKPPVAIKPPLAVPVAIKPPLTRPPMPAVPKPQAPAAVREPAAPVRTEVRTLDDIKYVDDLKKIEVKHLRQGELVVQTAKIKSKITYLALANRLFTHQTINAFEQSPLFKTYLMMGEMLIANTDVDRKAAFEQTANKLRSSGREVLSLAEFEAVADLKKELGKM